MLESKGFIQLDDIVEVVTKADSSAEEKVATDVVDSDVDVKDVKDDVDVKDVKDVIKDEVKADDEPKDEDIVGLNIDLPIEPTEPTEPTGELIDSEVREDEDIKRDEFLSETRDICDSADYGVDVKMPMLKGRHSYRSAVFAFVKLNPQFLSKKYSNLRLDSLNNELCDEVKADMFNNIKNSKPQVKQVIGGFVETGKGYRLMENF